MASLRDLGKHSFIYGIGQVLSRATSIIMLPVYTTYLDRGDYGVIAILDLIAATAAILVAGGMAAALCRHHYEATSEEAVRKVWWTGLALVAISGGVSLGLGWQARELLGRFSLGMGSDETSLLFAMLFPTIWLMCIGQVSDQYFRVRKWSTTIVAIMFGTLLLNILLNVIFLAVFQLGVAGVLLGNLLTMLVRTALRFFIFYRAVPPSNPDVAIVRQLLQFGLPILATGVLAIAMHQADRYFLRIFCSLEDVGLYSLAYQIGRGVNTLILAPFGAIWGVSIYEISARPDRLKTFSDAFRYFVYGLSLVLLAVSLFSPQILMLMSKPDFWDAAPLIPPICLAYLLFSLHIHFQAPALLNKQTATLMPAYVLGAFVNFVSNWLLIPRMGPMGAAIATILSFGTFSLVGYLIYSRIERFPYPFWRCTSVVLGMIATYFIVTSHAIPQQFTPTLSALAVLAWSLLLLEPLSRVGAFNFLRIKNLRF